MEIKKIDNYCEIFFGEQRFVFDPPDLQKEPPIILTDPSLKVNKDKIFNSPGEYNVGNVYFRGFADKNSISYLFENKEGRLFYLNGELSEETLKKLKLAKIEIDALVTKVNVKPEIFSALKPKVIFSFKDLNLPKFQKEKVNKVKVNLAKVENLIYLLQ